MELIFCCVKERDDLMVNIIKEDDSNKDRIGMGMICVSDSPNDIQVYYHELFESIPE